MPARARPRPSHPATSRCRYVDDAGYRCRRVATVAGGFCRQCAIALELDLEEGGAADRLVGTMDRILARGARDPMLSGAAAFLGGLLGAQIIHRAPPSIQEPVRQMGRMAADAARARAEQAAKAQAEQRRAQPPPRPPDPETARALALRDARTTLGFEPDEKLTVDQVKERKRALARVYHPDLGNGSVKQMQRVNAAADLLIAKLERPTAARAGKDKHP
jgi:hypothetical protein